MAKKNLLDEQIEATEAQIALINSALEVIEKELEEKGAELAVVQDKYDATMVKFRARARASYEAVLSGSDIDRNRPFATYNKTRPRRSGCGI